MKRLYLLLTLLCTLAASSLAGASLLDRLSGSQDGPLDVDQAYIFSGVEEAPGRYRLHWAIEDGYYLYRDKVKLLTPEGVALAEMRAAPAEQKDDPLFGQVWVYYHEAVVEARFEAAGGVPDGAALVVEYQGCWEGGICYPPVRKTLELGAVPVEAAQFQNSVAEAASVGNQGFSLTDQARFSDALAGGGLWVTLGLFFVAGLALAFTPCVLPMIPILASVIAGQGAQVTPRRSFVLALVYVLAMSLTYTLAGVFAGVFGENLQAALQTPWVIVLFALVFVLLSGAMFGFYQLQVPQSVQNRLNRLSRSQQGGQLSGVAVMGFLSALIVGPCVAAPLAGALIYIGQSGDPLLGGAALFALSLGMGVPLLLVGASAGSLLPRAGGWMNQVKNGFGVVLLLMAVWMLDRIVATEITMLLTGVILVVTACYLHALDGLPADASGWYRLGKGVGLLMLIYGGALLVGVAAGNRSMLYPLQGVGVAVNGERASPELEFATVTSMEGLQPLLEQARTDSRPVMLDFYADWCVSCKELEAFTFADADVQKQLQRFELVRVDVTAHDDAAKALYKRFNIIGPPALIFFDSAGEELLSKMVIGVPGTRQFAGHLAEI
ncbi:protein-disulfide reductase DsbD [Motiliproteus sediminis]|uniref:protein-disulfide reductase DsbD n=1 Tax=Motiliproteus sediminis TaxID=1468178 RepID=UPI001AEFFF31|nr:protein-disulfide reductase DsbD [Motiliproteus sediminis]